MNTNYGRVNGFLVYLYDGPRVPEFDRPGFANVDKIKATVSVFLGIPYAQPPVKEARLMVSNISRDAADGFVWLLSLRRYLCSAFFTLEPEYTVYHYAFFISAAKTSSWLAKLRRC